MTIRSFARALVAVAAVAALAGCAPSPAQGQLLNKLPDRSTKPCVSNVRSTATPDPKVAQAESVAMAPDTFWRLIATLHASNSDRAYSRLSTHLSKLPESQIIGFDARLTLSLYALDDECRARWDAQHNPVADGFVADDDFLYDRADTVTAGRATWTRAVATDSLPWGAVDIKVNDGEDLLYVAEEAAEKAGIKDSKWEADEDKAFTLDAETGDNPSGWPATSK